MFFSPPQRLSNIAIHLCTSGNLFSTSISPALMSLRFFDTAPRHHPGLAHIKHGYSLQELTCAHRQTEYPDRPLSQTTPTMPLLPLPASQSQPPPSQPVPSAAPIGFPTTFVCLILLPYYPESDHVYPPLYPHLSHLFNLSRPPLSPKLAFTHHLYIYIIHSPPTPQPVYRPSTLGLSTTLSHPPPSDPFYASIRHPSILSLLV